MGGGARHLPLAAGGVPQLAVFPLAGPFSLGGVEVVAPFQAVVFVSGALGKEASEGVHIGRDVLRAQPRRQAPIQEPGRRVGRPVKTMGKSAKRLVFLGESRAQFDDVESGAWGKLEAQVERFPGHQRSTG